MQKTLIDNGVQPNRMTTIHNWCDGSEIYPLEKSENPFVVEHGLEDQSIDSYSGNLGLGHDLVAVQDTMDHFKK